MTSQACFCPTHGKYRRVEDTVDLREPDVTRCRSLSDWEQPAEGGFRDESRIIRVPILASNTVEIIPVRLRSIRHKPRT